MLVKKLKTLRIHFLEQKMEEERDNFGVFYGPLYSSSECDRYTQNAEMVGGKGNIERRR